ncbi:MAG: EamA family transporter, partial [Cyanobacteria bacterium J06576_12]
LKRSANTGVKKVNALLFSTLFLAESLSGLQWGGVGLTLVSIYLINQRSQLAEKVSNLITSANSKA